MSSKTRTLESHARRRLKQRYGLKYSDDMLSKIKRAMDNSQAKCIHRQSIRVGIFEMSYHVGKKDILDMTMDIKSPTLLRFAYDKERHTIITFLPPNEDIAFIPRYSEELYD